MRKLFLLFAVLLSVAAYGQYAEIAPFVRSKWGQHEPYNQQCPYYYTNSGSTYRCNAGCVAVAMAQVMYYYRYPAATQESIKGYPNPTFWTVYTEKKILGVKVKVPHYYYATLQTYPANTALYWSSMCDVYDGSQTDVENYAVSMLVLLAGESVVMNYDRSSSADPRTITDALVKKFGYPKETVRYVARKNYSDAAWVQLLYGELAAGRPVIYGGLKANGSGHSFILDGYKDGLFHVVWGDDGYHDDYFSLNQMDPTAHWGGTDGYNREQDAIIGIAPPGVTDAVQEVEADGHRPAADDAVYDLQGRRVVERPLKKGIYIIGGRKVLISEHF